MSTQNQILGMQCVFYSHSTPHFRHFGVSSRKQPVAKVLDGAHAEGNTGTCATLSPGLQSRHILRNMCIGKIKGLSEPLGANSWSLTVFFKVQLWKKGNTLCQHFKPMSVRAF